MWGREGTTIDTLLRYLERTIRDDLITTTITITHRHSGGENTWYIGCMYVFRILCVLYCGALLSNL
jgi:hypothetical protein